MRDRFTRWWWMAIIWHAIILGIIVLYLTDNLPSLW